MQPGIHTPEPARARIRTTPENFETSEPASRELKNIAPTRTDRCAHHAVRGSLRATVLRTM